MRKTALELKCHTALELQSSRTAIATENLSKHIDDWVLDGECRLYSKNTIETRRVFLKNLHWFLNKRSFPTCGLSELRAFFAYLARGHEEPEGRWGNPHKRKPLRPMSVKDYHGCLRVFFDWLVSDGLIEDNPMLKIPVPVVRLSQKPPLSPENIAAILAAARNGLHPRRDETIIMLLLDTGMRSSELCSLKISDIDLPGRRCVVLGKGNKVRTVFFGRNTVMALSHYLRRESRAGDEPLFLAQTGKGVGGAITRSGLQQIVRKLGVKAGLKTQVSPHSFRRTFAVEILKNGANVFSLKEMLGHTRTCR